jgi:hypothetical protein
MQQMGQKTADRPSLRMRNPELVMQRFLHNQQSAMVRGMAQPGLILRQGQGGLPRARWPWRSMGHEKDMRGSIPVWRLPPSAENCAQLVRRYVRYRTDKARHSRASCP